MANPRATLRALGSIAALGVLGLGATLTACSGKNDGQLAAQSTSTSQSPSVTVMLDGHTHTISTGIECATSAAQPTATPAESGNQTTRVHAQDDSASVSLSLSDETPPTVDGFALSLKAGSSDYQMPYQSVQSASQVEVTRQGKSYTLAGTGQTVTSGQSAARELQFGIHVTCP